LTTPRETTQNLDVLVYNPKNQADWDKFVCCAKNGVFLFCRDYMEYHSHRFTDHSLMFYNNNKLVALLPASLEGSTLCSHGGLTFGGIISAYDMKTPLMLQIFDALSAHCHNQSITEMVYKPTPYIYHSIPAQEDLYALFSYNAYLVVRNVSSAIYLPHAKEFDGNRKANLRKAKKNNLTVHQSDDFNSFMQIAEAGLIERHGVKPVHSAEEIKLLAKRFPDNIKLFASFKEETMLAGIVIYESQNVAHVQYAANSKAGRNIGAQDIVENYLIKECYSYDKRYFDFGISTEKQGTLLNVGLIQRKENFGASAIVYDTYKIIL